MVRWRIEKDANSSRTTKEEVETIFDIDTQNVLTMMTTYCLRKNKNFFFVQRDVLYVTLL